MNNILLPTSPKQFFLALLAIVVLISAFVIFNSQSENKRVSRIPKNADEFEENEEKREQWFDFERSFPNDKIPDDARRKAWLARPDEAHFSGGELVSQWESIGPRSTQSDIPNWGLTSGRINAIAVSPSNPQLILLGTATGGVWRSTDGGANFSPTSDGQIDLAVGSIAFAPSDNSIVYAGMGDKASNYFGSGVLKSTDSGQTWTQVSNTTLPSPGRISKIEVDTVNPNRVYVAQYSYRSGNSSFSSGFFVSSDGGVSWTKTISGLARDLIRHPAQPNTLYLALARNDSGTPSTGGIFKSDNNGMTWTRIYTSPFTTTSNMKIAVTPVSPQSLYVLSGATGPNAARLETSTDEGVTWTNRGSNFDVAQLSYNFYLFVNPADANTIYVGTRDMWRSTDLGVAFTNITNNFSLTGQYNPFNSKAHPDQHHFYISPTDPNTIYLANDGGLYRSTNNAASFQSLNASLNLTMFTSIDLHPTDNSMTYAGTQDNGTQRRRGSSQWTEFVSGDGGQTVIDSGNPAFVYETYVNYSIDRWSSNTDSFDARIGSATIFNNDPVAFYPPFVGNGVDSTIYFGTNRLYISTNRGTDWTPPGGATILTFGSGDVLSTIGVGKSNTGVIYTGSAQGRVMVSLDGGANWSQITTGLPTRFIKSIIVSPTDSNTAYLTVSGFDSGHIFKTVNGGANWTDISGNLPNIPTNTILIDPRNPLTLYAGTDIGVFRSMVGGNTWETFNNGMPPVIVTELDANASGLIQASTYGRGAYQFNTAPARKPVFDFDGDTKTDLGIFRPNSGEWWINRSASNQTTAVQFGTSTDKLVPGDYTGDGKTDIAFWRPSTGQWFIIRSEDSSFYAFPFGSNGDIPAPGDFDGDGKADVAVFRPSNTTWYILRSSDNSVTATQFGITEDLPVVADYDGDGKEDIGIFRPSVSQWWILRSSAGLIAIQFGQTGDKTVPGDYTGDGKTDIAFWRPSSGEWFIIRSEDSSFYAFPFGLSTDIPTPGDYDGDGKADAAIFRPSSSTWYLQRSTSGFTAIGFGTTGDQPLPNVYVR
ncbi:MAG: FG-GAP-like repeat-containing protein [Pyrinomonadaceae bacterium]